MLVQSDEMTDAQEFAMLAGHVSTVAEAFLKEMYGERCPDYEESCECCKRWKALDQLIDDPFAALEKLKAGK